MIFRCILELVMPKLLKIVLIIIISLGLAVALVRVFEYRTYESIRTVARSLPTVNGQSIADGMNGRHDCYAIPTKSNCPVITFSSDLRNNSKAIDTFIAETEKLGVTWDRTNLRSNVFERDKQQYQIYIGFANENTIFSLMKY